MDNNRGQRRHNDPPMHGASSQRYQSLHEPSHQRRSSGGTSGVRYRPAPLSTSSSGTARAMGGSTSYSSYYQDSGAAFSSSGMPQSAMGYHQSGTDYAQADARQTQGFAGTYNPTAMMYNVQQAAGAQSTGVYDAQQFPSRQATGLQIMPTDVTGPYFSSEPTNAAAASAMQTQAGTTSTAQVYQHSGPSSYSMGGMASMGGMSAQTTQGAEVGMDGDYPEAAAAAMALDEAYARYQTKLRETFQHIRTGSLAAASSSVLELSEWLLGKVTDLGLTSDDHALYNDRIKLWKDFNHAWLALFQRQKEVMESGQQTQRAQSLISREVIDTMGKEIVRLCDSIERFGLVDYQYGVWEEQIVAIIEECLDLYDTAEDAGGNGASSGSHYR